MLWTESSAEKDLDALITNAARLTKVEDIFYDEVVRVSDFEICILAYHKNSLSVYHVFFTSLFCLTSGVDFE